MWGILATFVGNRSYSFNSMSIHTRNPVHCRTVIILHARYMHRRPNSLLAIKNNLESQQQNHQHNDDSDDHDNNNNNDNDNDNNKWQTMMAMKKTMAIKIQRQHSNNNGKTMNM